MKMKEFKYDVVTLIECVRDRPCLWDKSLENYKDRVERRTAWEEIFNVLDVNYEEMTPEEKRIMGELVLNKWTNVRDTFMKTLKTKMGRPKRKYILHEHLKFLTKLTPDIECQEFIVDVATPFFKAEDDVGYNVKNIDNYSKTGERNDFEVSHRKKSKKLTDLTDNSNANTSSNEEYVHKRRSKRNMQNNTTIYDSANDLDFVEVDESNDPRIMNEDEAFFASLLPTVVKYNEDERLEFRIEVLAVMKRIKDKKKWPGDSQ